MDILKDLIIPLMTVISTVGGTVIAVVIYITKQNSRHEKNEAVTGVMLKNIMDVQEKMITNHLPHLDAKLDAVMQKVDSVDKELYAHLKMSEKKQVS